MRRHAVALVAASALLACGCSSGRSASFERDGPPFHEVYASAGQLLEAPDPIAATRIVRTLQIPETREFHAGLVEAVANCETLSVDQLLLVTAAVSPALRDPDWVSVRITGDRGDYFVEPSRGAGRFADVIDEILVVGENKLPPISAYDAGRILGRTQSDAALEELAGRLLPEVDDGSAAALESLLSGMRSAGARSAFVRTVLLGEGPLSGEREWIALSSLSYDSDRLAAVQVQVGALPRLDAERLERYVGLLSYDSSRLELIRSAGPRLAPASHADLRRLLQMLSYDSSRSKALDELAGRASGPMSAGDLEEYLALFSYSSSRERALGRLLDRVQFREYREILSFVRAESYDSSRGKTLRRLLRHSGLGVDGDQLVRTLALFQYDSDRMEALEYLEGHLDGGLGPREVRDLLQLWSYDSDRVELLRRVAPRMAPSSQAEKRRLLELIHAEDDRLEARNILLGESADA